jgi:hypothetical protein
MTQQSLGRVGLRLIGVYALAQAAVAFPDLTLRSVFLVGMNRGSIPLIVAFVLFPFALLLLSGYFLFAHPAAAARWVWRRGGGGDVEISKGLANVAFGAAGIIVLAHALPHLAESTAAQLEASESFSLKVFSGGLAEVLLAAFLLSDAGVVADYWGGRDRPRPQPDETSQKDREVAVRLANLVIAAAGVVMFAATLPALIPASIELFSPSGRGAGRALLPFSGEVARAAIGIFLFFRSALVIEFVSRRHRTAEGAS